MNCFWHMNFWQWFGYGVAAFLCALIWLAVLCLERRDRERRRAGLCPFCARADGFHARGCPVEDPPTWPRG